MSDHTERTRPRGADDPLEVPRYKIGTVASLVGLSTNVLRAWERRYAIARPARQSGRQRLYSERDVQLLRRIVEMTQHGLSIGEVVALGPENLLNARPPVPHAPTAPGPRSTRGRELPRPVRQSIQDDLPTPEAPARSERYAGESLDVSVRSLSLGDAATLHSLYQVVKGLYELWTYMDHRPVSELVIARLRHLQEPTMVTQLHRLGWDTRPTDPMLEAALQDARGGALLLMLERLENLNLETCQPAHLALLISLARDHAKVLRSAFGDLDPALREADECLKAHQVIPILAKIEHLKEGGWVGEVGSDFSGFITCRCLETSCLDRLLYRCLTALAQPSAPPPNLWVAERPNGWVRWVFERTQAGPPAPLDRFSVHLVSLASGLSPDDVLRRGYAGTRHQAGRAWMWFHWPSYSPPSEVAPCSCHPLG